MNQSNEILVTLVRKYVGCSLLNRKDELGVLVARGVDAPNKVVGIKTNCATFALGIMHEAGVVHPLLEKPYVLGMAVAWVRTIGKDLKALTKYTKDTVLPPGALLHYYTPGKNNNHVEWLLSEVAPNKIADHAGGGRSNNAVTLEHGSIDYSAGRPLQEWLDPRFLLPYV
jgi:hypothetical protein